MSSVMRLALTRFRVTFLASVAAVTLSTSRAGADSRISVSEWEGLVKTSKLEIHIARILGNCNLRDNDWLSKVGKMIIADLINVTEGVDEPAGSTRTLEERQAYVKQQLIEALTDAVPQSQRACEFAANNALTPVLDMLVNRN